MADAFKFRIDHHGSLVRPAALVAARQQWRAGSLDEGSVRTAEDTAIAAAVRMQRQLSLSVVTDGHLRREDFRSAVFDAVDGFRRAGEQSDGLARWVAADELKVRRSLVADDIAAVAAQTRIPAKATLPSPALLAAQCFDSGSSWRSARHLGEALAYIIREKIELLIARGIRCIQLDHPGYAWYLFGGDGPGLTLEDSIAIDARAVQLSAKPADVRIGLCPTHHAVADVDQGAATRLFDQVPVDRWILPYRRGVEAEVQLLRAVPADRDACLGVVDPTAAQLEDIDTVMDRMDVAAAVKDIDDLAVCPSAGLPMWPDGRRWTRRTSAESSSTSRRLRGCAGATNSDPSTGADHLGEATAPTSSTLGSAAVRASSGPGSPPAGSSEQRTLVTEPSARRRRPVNVAQVRTAERLTPHMIRLVLGGAGLAAFDAGEFTDHYVKLLFEVDGVTYPEPFDMQRIRAELPREQWPRMRTYTVRRWVPDVLELTIDVVHHGEEGLAGPWAARLRPGDTVRFVGPGGGYTPATDAEWYLFVGDESAIPAIAASLERLPRGSRAHVFIEVSDRDEEQKLDTVSDAAITWLHRADARVGDALVRAVSELDSPAGPVDAFVHGEAGAVKELRRLLLIERGIPRDRVSISGYWRLGHDEDGWQATKQDWNRQVEQEQALPS